MSKIVVGFDGSSTAQDALRWAAEEAERRSTELSVIQSWNDPVFLGPSLSEAWLDPGASRRTAHARFEEQVSAVAEHHPKVQFSTALVSEPPAKALLSASEDASFVVIGSRGLGGFASLLLGSVGQRVASAAESTVVIVRQPGAADGGVVVGVDGSEPSRRALAWAAEAARQRSCPLRVVLAWNFLSPQGEHGSEEFRSDYTEADAWKTLGAIVDDVLGDEPDVEIDLQAICDLPAKALLAQAQDASLLVVGPRGWSKRPQLDLGSVTWQVLHHVTCPMAIVR